MYTYHRVLYTIFCHLDSQVHGVDYYFTLNIEHFALYRVILITSQVYGVHNNCTLNMNHFTLYSVILITRFMDYIILLTGTLQCTLHSVVLITNDHVLKHIICVQFHNNQVHRVKISFVHCRECHS